MGMSAAPGAFSSLRAVIDQEHFTDAETVIEGRVRGMHSAEFLGFPPTGRDVELPFVALVQFGVAASLPPLSAQTLSAWTHGAMLLGMLGAALYRRAEYSANHQTSDDHAHR